MSAPLISFTRERGLRLVGRRIDPFWAGFGVLLVAAIWTRFQQLGMPPLDFPADRQRTNCMLIDAYREGASLFSQRRAFLELPLIPWLTARTAWLAKFMGWEIWGLARLWTALFGAATVALAAPAAYWAADPTLAPPRRRRLALLFMAAMAFNPYHQQLSRMILTEAPTLAFQMGALALFWIAYRKGGRLIHLALFGLVYLLACWAKIPSLIWAPGYFLYFLFFRRYRFGVRLSLLAVAAIAVGAVFWVYRINPFTFREAYVTMFPRHGALADSWMGTEIWNRSFGGRTVQMLTLPGVFFALVGLTRAPWLFRITLACALALLYPLNTLNTYNFCHLIIPGTALAVWGTDFFIEAASARSLAQRMGWTGRAEARAMAGGRLAGCLFVVAIIAALGPLGPADPYRHVPPSELIEAVDVIGKSVPKGSSIITDDMDGSLFYLLGQPFDTRSQTLDLRTGYYYSIRRFDPGAIRKAADAWTAWASLPGEPGGLLFTPRTQAPALSTLTSQTLTVLGLAADAALPLSIESLQVPVEGYDRYGRVLTVRPGQTVRLGIRWKNSGASPLAGMRWSLGQWRQYVPVPLRAGGFSMQSGGVLCLPEGERSEAVYTFEIPEALPAGRYYVNYYAQSADRWRSPDSGFGVLPFNIQCSPPKAPTLTRIWRDLWPIEHNMSPTVWSRSRCWGGMRLIGYRFDTPQAFLLSCPASEPGRYGLTIEGEGEPVYSPEDPAALWPSVEVYLPSDPAHPVATTAISHRATSRFRIQFTAQEPFDSLLLKARVASRNARPMPPWVLDFNQGPFGHQVLALREVTLDRLDPLPGAAPSASAEFSHQIGSRHDEGGS